VQAAQAAFSEQLQSSVEHVCELVGGGDVEAAREHVTRVEADADSLVAAREIEERPQLPERAADRVTRAGRVLEKQPAAVRLAERVPHHLADAWQRLLLRLADRRPGVHDHAVGPDLVAHPQGVDERGGRLLAHLAVLRGRVDEVDRMDRGRLDRAPLHQR
jgi:hypothetical protein